jgi:hypothetical protein
MYQGFLNSLSELHSLLFAESESSNNKEKCVQESSCPRLRD